MRRSFGPAVYLIFLSVTLIPTPSAFAAEEVPQELLRRIATPLRLDLRGRYVEIDPPTVESSGPAGPRGDLVTRNLVTGEDFRVASPDRPGAPLQDYTRELPARIGALYDAIPGTEEFSYKNYSDWSLVPDPTTGNYPRHVKLIIQATDIYGAPYTAVCSGVLIDPLHVLTAGHCIYMHQLDDGTAIFDWVDQVTVVPGYQNGSGPWGFANSTELHAWTGWTENEDTLHDVGVIDLDRPVGALVGWYGHGYSGDCSWWTSSGWFQAAYPAVAPYDGQSMYQHGGSYDTCSIPVLNRVSFGSPSGGGSSGSGAVKDEVAWGVHVQGTDTSSYDNTLTAAKYLDILNFMNADRPANPDLQPLYALVGSSGEDVAAGTSAGAMSFRVHNYSNAAWSSSIPYELVLSADSLITSVDRVIQTGSIGLPSGLDALATYGALVSDVTIPADVDSGKYFLGVRLQVADANGSNDVTGWQDVDWINVTCPGPDPPALLAPADNANCQPHEGILLQWESLGEGYTYQYQAGLTSCGFGTVTATPDNSATLGYLLPDRTHYWRVRAVSPCGAVGDWSSCFSFHTEPEISPPTVTYPPDGDLCQPANQVTVDWQDVPGAAGYQIRLMSSCGLPVTPISTTLSARTFLNLQENETYYHQVRTLSACGNYGAWSDCGSFTTKPAVMATPTSFFPQEGWGCVGDSGSISWNAIEAAGSYEVQLSTGTDCSGGEIHTTSTNSLVLPPLPEGPVHWRVRSVHPCGDVSAWSQCNSFSVDLTPPTQPTWIQSKDHVPGQWSADSDLGMAWEVSVDEDCGLVFYEIVWNESNQPPTLPWFTGVPNAEYTVSPLADGAEWWFHAWAHDGAANYVAQPVSAGPFLIDTTPPTPPNLHPSLPPGQWTNTTSLNIDWDGALDDGSGLAGYHWLLDQAVSTDPSITPVRPDSSETYAGLVEGQHWFHLSPVDAVDNTGPPQHLGPFLLDLTPPSGEITQPPVGSVLHHTDPVLIEWIASDVLSGVAQISLFWSPDGYDTLYPIADGSAAQMGNSWNWTVPFVVEDQLWLEMVLEDGAGNQAVFELPAPYEVTRAVGVDGPVASVPDRLVLGRNVPNPFNPQTEIVYALPAEGMVRLVVYDASGRAVRTLVSEVEKGPAWHRVIWDGRADDGRRVSSGAYFYRLEAAGEARSRRMVLVK